MGFKALAARVVSLSVSPLQVTLKTPNAFNTPDVKGAPKWGGEAQLGN